jgi:hypothetical protein
MGTHPTISGDGRRWPSNERRGPEAAPNRAEGAPGLGRQHVVRSGRGRDNGGGCDGQTWGGHGVGSGGGGGGLNCFMKCGRGTVRRVEREGVGAGTKSTQTSVMVRYIRRLTDECTGLSSSVQATFLGAGIEEYSLVIFLGIVIFLDTE